LAHRTLVAASAGIVTVALVAVLGWRFYGPRAGLLAAAIMAAVPFEAIQTHYASVDVLLGTTTALTLLAACAFTVERRPLLAARRGERGARLLHQVQRGHPARGAALGAARGRRRGALRRDACWSSGRHWR